MKIRNLILLCVVYIIKVAATSAGETNPPAKTEGKEGTPTTATTEKKEEGAETKETPAKEKTEEEKKKEEEAAKKKKEEEEAAKKKKEEEEKPWYKKPKWLWGIAIGTVVVIAAAVGIWYFATKNS